MEKVYILCLVFGVIIAILTVKKPLSVAMLGGLITAIFAYRLPIMESISIVGKAAISPSTITLILSFYSITFLQRMLEKRHRLKQAQESLDGIFNNRRINSSVAPAVIGLLPSAGAVTICGSMVDDSCEDYLSKEDKTFVTSFFRHIPECFLPTYAHILIAISLSGVDTGSFVIAMVPMVIVLFLLGHVFYLKKIPRSTGSLPAEDKKAEIIKNLKSMWTIILTVALILIFNMQVYYAVAIVIVLNFIVDKFKFEEVIPFFTSAIEMKVILNTVLIMMFKDIITYTGVINDLPALFSQLPIPMPLVFALIFFFGTVISGSTAIIALCMPMAITAMPDGGVPLVVLLMCSTYAAMQVSPTHICLFICTDYFKTELGPLIKRTIPVISTFCVIALGYSMLLNIIM